MSFGPWSPNLTAEERMARFRELRALAYCRFGAAHPFTRALERAASDPAEARRAHDEFESLPALPRRRLLSDFAILLRPHDTPRR